MPGVAMGVFPRWASSRDGLPGAPLALAWPGRAVGGRVRGEIDNRIELGWLFRFAIRLHGRCRCGLAFFVSLLQL